MSYAVFEKVSEYITTKYQPLSHASPHVLAEAFGRFGITVTQGPLPDEECTLCGREYGECHSEGCEAIETDGKYVGAVADMLARQAAR